MFTIFNLESQSFLAPRAIFADGKAAAKASRLLSAKTGRKYQPRPLPKETHIDWQSREKSRFENGDYLPLCDELAAIAPKDHFAHISKKRPELIAYTKDAIKGAQDIQSVLSIKSYIDLIAPDYYSEIAKDNLAKLQRTYALQLLSPVKFAGPCESEENADLIESIYTNYDESVHALNISCMRHKAREFQSDNIHPTRVYASPDVAIAYMQNEKGETIARCLTWPAKKLFSRVYSDNSVLYDSLIKLGYSPDSYFDCANKSLAGARLQRIELGRGGFVMPYVDGMERATDNGRYIVLDSSGELTTRETNGTSGADDSVFCESCEEFYREDDMRVVYTNSRRTSSTMYCEHCVSGNTFYCEGYDVYFTDNVDSMEVEDRVYSLHYAENHFNYCDGAREYTRDSLVEVIINDDDNSEYWSRHYAQENAYRYDGKWFSEDIEFVDAISQRFFMPYPHKALVCIIEATRRIPLYIAPSVAYIATDGKWYARDCLNYLPNSLPAPAIFPENYHGA